MRCLAPVAGLGIAVWTAFVLAVPGSWAQQPAPGVEERIQALQRSYEQEMRALRTSYESRISALEGEVGHLRGQLEELDTAEEDARLETEINSLLPQDLPRQGIGSLGQTTIFDNVFNPAISVTGDFVVAASNLNDSYDLYNQFILRSLEIGIAGRVDPLLAYYVAIHFDEGDVELEEAYGIADDWLPGTFTLKFGRYNMDFGKLSPLHEHDLPFVDKPGVLQEYLGGSLRGTGVELHQWFGLGESTLVRWSVGMVNRLDGDVHAVVGPLAGEHHHHHDDDIDAFGERDLCDFAYNARVTALFEVGSQSTLQIGASVAWSPNQREFLGGGDEHEEEEHSKEDLKRLIWGLDVAYKWEDFASGEAFTLGGELLLLDHDFLGEHEEGHDHEEHAVGDETAFGFYVYGLYSFDRYWSIGASFDWFERAMDDSDEWWDAGAWVTYRLNEFNRLRLEGRYVEDDLLDDGYWVLMLQWTTLLGTHGHGIDW
jgi:hypothetical protein